LAGTLLMACLTRAFHSQKGLGNSERRYISPAAPDSFMLQCETAGFAAAKTRAMLERSSGDRA
jgi:hypothetical protein